MNYSFRTNINISFPEFRVWFVVGPLTIDSSLDYFLDCYRYVMSENGKML